MAPDENGIATLEEGFYIDHDLTEEGDGGWTSEGPEPTDSNEDQ